jgi:hypothetical protein
MEEEGERQNMISEVRGGGFISDLGIPVVSNLAGLFGLGSGGYSGGMSGGAKAQGKALGEHLMRLHGAGWWDDFKSGFNMVMKPIASIAKPLLPLAGPYGAAASAGLGALGYGKRGAGLLPGYEPSFTHNLEGTAAARRYRAEHANPFMRGGKHTLMDHLEHPTKGYGRMVGCGSSGGKRGQSDKMKRRSALIKKLRAEKGMSMIEASKYIKSHNLSY